MVKNSMVFTRITHPSLGQIASKHIKKQVLGGWYVLQKNHILHVQSKNLTPHPLIANKKNGKAT
jgi:hypothetical protein